MNTLIENLKDAGQDYEFYPTTDEILRRLVRDLKQWSPEKNRWDRDKRDSVLDIGAGNGKVLQTLKDAELGFSSFYAIEKSPILYGSLPENVLVIGTAFEEQSLLSKEVDVIFSNPPYSIFSIWAEKIVRESCAPAVYLVLPRRWEESVALKAALKARGATAKVLGEYDFEDAEDRQARAKVHLLRIHIPGKACEAFETFFETEFAGLKERFKAVEPDAKPVRKAEFGKLTVGENCPEALAALYQLELAKIQRNYQAAASLDVELMREFGISPDSICACLKKRLGELRMDYWNELFSKLSTLTDRLTVASRKSLLSTLHRHVHVDFTVSNIQAVILWAVRNVNRFIESQLLAVYENLVDVCNVRNYKSNARVFQRAGWRYCQEREGWTHYALDFRVVCQAVGGIDTDPWGDWKKRNNCGLTEACYDFISDLLVIANNLGFSPDPHQLCMARDAYMWKPGESETLCFTDRKGKGQALFTGRAFKNRNLHLKFNKKFILALNVEHGRLRGWLNDGAHAAEELQEPAAGQFFACTAQLLPGTSFARLGVVAAPAVELDTSDTPDEVEAPAPAPARSEAVRTVKRAQAIVEGMPGAVELAKLVQGLRGCCAEFRRVVAELAKLTGRAEWRVYQLWREYSDRCSDQSALLSEFVTAYAPKLGADVRALEEIVSGYGVGADDSPAWQALKAEAMAIPPFEPVGPVVEVPRAPVVDLFELVA